MEYAKHQDENWNNDGPVYPIDETDDLQDPFSDLSLFLAQRIKGEVTKFGGAHKWSSQIQTELLEKILPEFRQTFPKHRLGISALRKMWEKVAYYYGKVQGQKDALRGDGKLNIAFMIRENLKHNQARHLPSSLPPYHKAHQIAVKICECIATLDGEKPNVETLTKLIWSAQKHLIADLSSLKAKCAYEEYGAADKLIVKTQLETLYEMPNLSKEQLAQEVEKRLSESVEYTREHPKEQLYSCIAQSLAKKLYKQTSIATLAQDKKQQVLEFIQRQIELCTLEEDREEFAYIEAIQRVLALYPLADALPKEFDESMIRSAIKMTYSLLCGECEEISIPLDGVTYAFINAEIHFLSRKEMFSSYTFLEDCIIDTLKMCVALPSWKEAYVDELEIALWHLFPKQKVPAHITREVTWTLLDASHLSFQSSVYRTIDFFQKGAKALAGAHNLQEKIDIWTGQNDMVCRWLHFDQTTPLFQLLLGKWVSLKGGEETVDHHAFVEDVYRTFVARFPLFKDFEEATKGRIWTLYKFMWYNNNAKGSECSYDRFIKWHIAKNRREGIIDRMNLVPALERYSGNALPLIPFSACSVFEQKSHS